MNYCEPMYILANIKFTNFDKWCIPQINCCKARERNFENRFSTQTDNCKILKKTL